MSAVLPLPELPVDIEFQGRDYVDYIFVIERNESLGGEDAVRDAMWVSFMSSRRKRYEAVVNKVSKFLKEPLYMTVILIEQELNSPTSPFVRVHVNKPLEPGEPYPWFVMGARAEEVMEAGTTPRRPRGAKAVQNDKIVADLKNDLRGVE